MKQLLSAVVALACGVALADEPAKPVVTMAGDTLAGYGVSLTAEENERQPGDDVTTSTIFLTVKRRPLAMLVR